MSGWPGLDNNKLLLSGPWCVVITAHTPSTQTWWTDHFLHLLLTENKMWVLIWIIFPVSRAAVKQRCTVHTVHNICICNCEPTPSASSNINVYVKPTYSTCFITVQLCVVHQDWHTFLVCQVVNFENFMQWFSYVKMVFTQNWSSSPLTSWLRNLSPAHHLQLHWVSIRPRFGGGCWNQNQRPADEQLAYLASFHSFCLFI